MTQVLNIANMRELLAIGRAGEWEIQVDKFIVDANDVEPRFGLTIANTSFYVQMEIPGLEILLDVWTALDSKESSNASLYFGSCSGAEVFLVDDEGRKRIKILSRTPKKTDSSELIEFNIMPDEVSVFGAALRDLINDLPKE